MHFELFLQAQTFSIDYKPKRFEVHAFSKENQILFYVRELSRKWLTVLCCAAARPRAIVTVVVRVLVLAQYVSSCGIFIFLLWLSCLLQSFETSAAIENSASCEVRLVIGLLLVKTLSILKLKDGQLLRRSFCKESKDLMPIEAQLLSLGPILKLISNWVRCMMQWHVVNKND